MIQHVVGQFSSARRLLAVGVLSLFSMVAGNGAFGQAPAPPAAAPAATAAPEIEAATIKPVKEPNPEHDA